MSRSRLIDHPQHIHCSVQQKETSVAGFLCTEKSPPLSQLHSGPILLITGLEPKTSEHSWPSTWGSERPAYRIRSYYRSIKSFFEFQDQSGRRFWRYIFDISRLPYQERLLKTRDKHSDTSDLWFIYLKKDQPITHTDEASCRSINSLLISGMEGPDMPVEDFDLQDSRKNLVWSPEIVRS